MQDANQIEAVGRTAHSRSVAEVSAALGVSAPAGLDEPEAERRLAAYGPNTIVLRQKISIFAVLLHQLQSPIVYLLGAAAALAFYFGELEEAGAIATVLALNALIGFATELKAARSIEALRSLGTRFARVRRAGRVNPIAADHIVPGDIVIVEAGDAIAADLRLVEAFGLGADESTLTGESVAVEKSTPPVEPAARLGDRASMLFKGTAVTRGSGVGIAVGTGLNSELGRISRLVEEAEPGSSPIERKLERLSHQLIWATLILTALIAGVGAATGKSVFLMVETAIALAVAAIPEGLPIVATLALARGMWRMARQNTLIERLSAVETLGATTVILTDKTGTLTENRMAVRRLRTSSDDRELTAAAEDDLSASVSSAGNSQSMQLLKIAVLCNDASLDSADDPGTGDPMEVALLRAGLRAGLKRRDLLKQNPLVRKFAFDSSSRMMATVHRQTDGFLFAVKGAPEAVLAAATDAFVGRGGAAKMDASARADWMNRVAELGDQGLRVLACAVKAAADAEEDAYRGLTFLGLIGLEDPARVDVPAAIRDCRQAGIRVVMVTGDHALTARSIGRAIGLGESAANVIEGGKIGELRAAGDGDLFKAGIVARVSPAEKLDLVRAYQAAGEVVAMTGDGVNDAPALRQADIGVAMGLRGTDVAREAAAMILLDDAFATIVKAIREGRVIFGNIRRFTAFLLACNLSEVLVIGLAILATEPLPILPLQILYLNLVTDVFPAFALAMGEGERGVLTRPPRDPKEPILGRTQWLVIVLQSLTMTAAIFGALGLARSVLHLGDAGTVTVTFLTLAFSQLRHVFNMRNAASNVVNNEVTRNPWIWGSLALCTALLAVPPHLGPMAQVLALTPPDLAMWTVIIGMSVLPTVVTQAAMPIVTTIAARRRSARRP